MKPFKVSLKDFLGIRNEKWYLKFEFKMKKSKFLRYFLQGIFYEIELKCQIKELSIKLSRLSKIWGDDHHRKCT